MKMATRKTKKSRKLDETLIGRLISVEYPTTTKKTDKWYDALIIGYQSERQQYKIFYIEEGSTEVIRLDERLFKFLNKNEIEKYGVNSMLFKRLAINLVVGFQQDEIRKIPFEAFVVRDLGSNNMELIYTFSNHIEVRIININDNHDKLWAILSQFQMELDYNPIVTWSFYPEHEIPIYLQPLQIHTQRRSDKSLTKK